MPVPAAPILAVTKIDTEDRVGIDPDCVENT
jgi:hypothetical protein